MQRNFQWISIFWFVCFTVILNGTAESAKNVSSDFYTEIEVVRKQ